MIIHYKEKKPFVHESAFVAPTAVIIGDCTIGEESSVWFGAVLRGDTENIVIGQGSNIQDNCTIHPEYDYPVEIGNHVTVGHNCILHGCRVKDHALIGMGAIILNGAVIEENVIVAAGSLVPQNKVIPKNSLAMGSPAKVIRSLTQEELGELMENATEYIIKKESYKNEEEKR